MNGALIYCSQTGYTQRYAEWLGEALSLRPLPFAKRGSVNLDDLAYLIFCSWLHASSIIQSKWLFTTMKRHPKLPVILFVTGATPPSEEGEPAPEVAASVARTFPPEEFPELTWFYGHGGFDFDRLGFADKLAMRLFFRINEKQATNDPEARAMVDGMRQGFDGTDRGALDPVIRFVQERWPKTSAPQLPSDQR